MLASELKECLLRTRARGARFLCVHTKKNESRDWKLFQSRLSCGTIAARLLQGGGRQMCLFYSASLKSTA
jgi:hypothetical protein